MQIGGVSRPIVQSIKQQQESADSRIKQADSQKEKLQIDDEFKNLGREVVRDKSVSNKVADNKNQQPNNQVKNLAAGKGNSVDAQNKMQDNIRKDVQAKYENPEGYLLDTYA